MQGGALQQIDEKLGSEKEIDKSKSRVKKWIKTNIDAKPMFKFPVFESCSRQKSFTWCARRRTSTSCSPTLWYKKIFFPKCTACSCESSSTWLTGTTMSLVQFMKLIIDLTVKNPGAVQPRPRWTTNGWIIERSKWTWRQASGLHQRFEREHKPSQNCVRKYWLWNINWGSFREQYFNLLPFNSYSVINKK